MSMTANTSSFIFRHLPEAPSELRARIGELWLADESACLDTLLPLAKLDDAARAAGAATSRAAGARGARRAGGGRRRGRLPARVRPVLQRGHGAHVPGRGAAAHPRCRDRGQVDRGSAAPGRLGGAPGRQRLAVRQCLDLGLDARRPDPAAGLRCAGRSVGLHAPAGGAGRRAGRARGAASLHAHARASVRHGPHHRRSPGARPQRRAPRLSPLLRHAGRGRAHRARRAALLRRLFAQHRGDRRRGDGRCQRHRRPGHLGEALGACIRATNSRSANGCWPS